MVSLIDWNRGDGLWDIQIKNGSRNRQKNHITLREFHKYIEEDKMLIKEIARSGLTSKHLLQFMSNFFQGKISLTKDEFVQTYKKGISLEDIAKKHNITRNDITFLRQLYNVKATGATYQNRKQTEEPLTDRQKHILYGSMMGDAGMISPSSAKFKHGIKQKDYLLWKHKEFSNLATEQSLKGETTLDKRSGNWNETWRFYTHANSDVEECITEFYKHETKEISPLILDNLNELSMAVWYMDDGKTDWSYSKMEKTDWDITPECSLCTDWFSKKSCNLIVDWLNTRWGIKSHLRQRKVSDPNKGYRVIIDSDCAYQFLNLIKSHMLPMFAYKYDFTTYLKKRGVDQVKISYTELIRSPKGDDFQSLIPEDQDHFIHGFMKYIRKKGFRSVFGTPESHIKAMQKILDYDSGKLMHDSEIGFNSLGNRFVISHFPNFWTSKAKASMSIKETVDNDRYLYEIVRSILIDGYTPKGSRLWQKLNRYRGNKSISSFMPCVAKAIYDKYCPKKAKVLDPCSGYGGRVTGAAASDKVLSYTGCEVNINTWKGLRDLTETLREYGDITKSMPIYNQDAIQCMQQFREDAFDFIFTSPPYFDAEEYDENQSQSCWKYAHYTDWFDEFLLQGVKDMVRISKLAIVNVANTGGYKIADDLRKEVSKEGLLKEEFRLRIPQFGGKFRYEPLFVLSK